MSIRYLLFTLLLVQTSAQAHLLKLFAYVEGDTLHGSVYFAGGANAVAAPVTLTGADGELSVTLTSDPQGNFSYRPLPSAEYHLRADTGDGHQADWTVQAEEFGRSAPAASGEITPPTSALADGESDEQRMAGLVERAVARQIGPLRAELQRNAARARLSDILGGIGFIFGLAGIALWWHGKRQAARR